MASQQQQPQPHGSTTGPSLLDRIAEEQAHVASRYQPVLSIDQLIEREKQIQYLVDNIMVEGIDYGWIPGARPKESSKPGEYQAKPTLFKAGAERACAFFGYVPKYVPQELIEEWTSERYGEMLFYYRYECTLTKSGDPVGSGIASATTWESKYRYRKGERECPSCGHSGAIIKGKAEYGGGWLCFAKKGGCGMKFQDGDESIESQPVEQVPNPDVADVINTVQKMAQKRAYVAATLTATGLSGRFTQDLEDLPAPVERKPQPSNGNVAPKSGRPIPPSLKLVVENIKKDPKHSKAAFTAIERLFAQHGAAGLADYNRVAKSFRDIFPKGSTPTSGDIIECLLDMQAAFDALGPVPEPGDAREPE